MPCDLKGKNIASNRGPLRIRDIMACRFAKGVPEILSYKFTTEVKSQEEHSNKSSAETERQHESSDIANKNQVNEVIMGELENEANPRTVAGEPSDSNHPKDTNCKDCSQEFWTNVEQGLRVYYKLSLCVTEKNGVEGLPNSKLRQHKGIHVGDVSECQQKKIQYDVHISFCLPESCRTLLTNIVKRLINKHPWMKKISRS